MATHYKGNPEEVRALNLFISLMRGTESFSADLHARLSEWGLTSSQFGVLETLYHLGSLTSSQLAEKHLRSRNNLSVVIANLVRDGFVLRKECPNDRRAHYIELSDKGRTTIEQILPSFVDTVVQRCKVLFPEEQELLRRLMKMLGKNDRQ